MLSEEQKLLLENWKEKWTKIVLRRMPKIRATKSIGIKTDEVTFVETIDFITSLLTAQRAKDAEILENGVAEQYGTIEGKWFRKIDDENFKKIIQKILNQN